MPWTVPDKGEGDNDLQSILFQEYLDALVDGVNGKTCVLSGCAVTGGASMTPSVAKGAVLSNGSLFAVAAGTVTISAADATNPRLDLIVVDSAGSKQVRTGAAAVNPKPAARSANDVVLAVVYVPANDTTIAQTQLTDMRVLREQGPVVLKKTTTAVTNNNVTAQQTYFSVTLPAGLLLTGKQVRVRCGGTYLSNSGTPTWTLAVTYDATTIFQDATAATTADADRGAWEVDFVISAQSNTVQFTTGRVTFQTPGAKTAATAGQGDLAVTTHVVTPFAGSSAIDSDAANRDLAVKWTMSVANAAVETSMQYAVAELL